MEENATTRIAMKESANARLRRARAGAGFKTAADFAKAHDLPESTYRSAENGTRGLRLEAARLYAPLLGVTWQWLIDDEESGSKPPIPANSTYRGNGSQTTRRDGAKPHSIKPDAALALIHGAKAEGAELPRLPVLGMAECGPDGWSLWNGDVIDTIPRPVNLVGARDAYAVYISGTSMEPRFFAGEAVHIHPGKPVTIGAFVLVQLRPTHDGESPRAVVKRLVKRSGSKIVLAQYNPPKSFDIKATEIVSMHRVVGLSEV